MRRIINSTYITLDGVIANPQTWPSGRVSDEAGVTIQTELIQSCDALLMGRRTYESFSAAWPSRSGDPISDRINSMAKYVVSSTLKTAVEQHVDHQWRSDRSHPAAQAGTRVAMRQCGGAANTSGESRVDRVRIVDLRGDGVDRQVGETVDWIVLRR